MSLSSSTVSWAEGGDDLIKNTIYHYVPDEIGTKIFEEFLLNSSVKELDHLVRGGSDQEIRKYILGDKFYELSKKAWLKEKKYRNLVDFPQYLVLREIKENFHDFRWRRAAVHLLMDPKTQFAEIPAGKFQMGNPASDLNRSDDELQHWVQLTSSTWMQRVPFTQLLFVLVTGQNHSMFREPKYCLEDHLVLETQNGKVSLCPRNPAENIAWSRIAMKDESGSADPDSIIGILREQFDLDTRLPTEAEWERGAQGPSKTYQPYSFGELDQDLSNLNAHAWYSGNSGGQTHRVATKEPNAYGLFDMHGNVGEWVEDNLSPYPEDTHENAPSVDPVQVHHIGGYHVFRGGNWANKNVSNLRSAKRDALPFGQGRNLPGLRLVLVKAP